MNPSVLDDKSRGIEFARETLADSVRRLYWFHSIDLGNGIITPGAKTLDVHQAEYACFFDPVELTGRSIIDIGAYNGAYSFEAKRRGAARVLATDHFVWNEPATQGRDAFELARSVLGIDLEVMDIDVSDLSPESVGTFDIALFLGVFYHLIDPIAALQQVARLAREVLIVETHNDALEINRPAMIMYPGAELNNDTTNWWGPNPACMVALLKECGFAKVDVSWSPIYRDRSVYHAWRTNSLRRFGNSAECGIDPNLPYRPRLTRRQKLHRGWQLIREALSFRARGD